MVAISRTLLVSPRHSPPLTPSPCHPVTLSVTKETPMPVISIRERGITSSGPVVAFDGQEYPIPNHITSPFDEQAEAQLAWYFEEHLRFPFTHQVRAQEAATSIGRYGEALFEQVLGERRIFGRYQTALQEGIDKLAFEIAGAPEFQQLHWEALKDPDLPQPFALHAPFVRRNLLPRPLEAKVREAPTINVLVVTARPGAGRDVGYRTISRPLVAALRQAGTPVTVDILRPGSYAALAAHLAARQDNQGAGYYHVIHFDVHGALLPFPAFDALEQKLATSRYTFQPQRYGRPKLPRYAGVKAFLFLESGAPEVADPVEASELAKLLLTHQIPIAILNACQSGKQVGASETSLGSQLMSAGMQMVLAMGYSVTVSAAETMMGRLYQQLFQSGDLAAAIRSARLELSNHKPRRAYFNQRIELEDWLLPVVYQNQPQRLTTRPFTASEQQAYYERQATRYREPPITYGFVGRDLDILHIEQRLLRHQEGRDQNLLLVRGLGGAGKSTLLHHLAAWWQTTGLVDQVAYFGYDERAWSLQQILDSLARQLLGEADYLRHFQPLSLAAQQSFLATRLRATRHLLILDNLESITGSNLAILHTLPSAEQRALHGFLRELAGGKSLVLLGSRGPETWLAPGTFDANVYDLPGLDAEAASTLADRVLARHNATGYRNDPAMQQDLQRLITLLDGHPLALEVVLANLAKQTPAEVLAALQSGAVSVDSATSTEDKTKSILACINYSHSNLSPDAQQLLLCLAPFTGVINCGWLPQYTEQLKAQLALANLPFHRWDEVLTEAINWGLLTPDRQLPIYLRIQPIFPYFLRTRWQSKATLRAAIESAFQQYYDDLNDFIFLLFQSEIANQRQLAQMLVHLEYENIYYSLTLTLQAQKSIIKPYRALASYLDAIHDYHRGLKLGEMLLSHIDTYFADQLPEQIHLEFVEVLDKVGKWHLLLKEYEKAKIIYQKSLELLPNLTTLDPKVIDLLRAMTYNQLGLVAYGQKQWIEAARNLQRSLDIKIKLNNRRSQATTYQSLGIVAQEQQQWEEAKSYHQQAHEIYVEFKDRYSQAYTHHNLSTIAHAQRKWGEAMYNLQQAYDIFDEFNDYHSQAKILHTLGIIDQEQRNYSQAKKYYQQAFALYFELTDRFGQADIYNLLGRVAQEEKQWKEAKQYYQRSYEIYTEFSDRHRQAGIYCDLGSIAQEQQQWQEAKDYYQQSLTLYTEFKDEHRQAGLFFSLGSIAQEQQQWQEAKDYYQQAHNIYIKYNDHYRQASIYGQLGLLEETQKHWSQASQHLIQALQIFLEFPEDMYIINTTIQNIARIHRAGGDATLPAAVAGVLGIAADEAAALLAGALANA
ncbi:MAG: CHAT domain-containing protein [Caldilinea sp. CFX5]|nr:CHAT domain-containing protein [Caldilinea sp. CFX5]